jgi:hypothetical protein
MKKNVPAVCILAMLLTVSSTLMMTSQDLKLVHAKDYSQSSSQANTCGNGFLASEVLCSNEQSEIQGDENIVSGFADQTAEPSGIGSYDTNKMGDGPKSDSTGQDQSNSNSTGQEEVKLNNNINDNTNAEKEVPSSSTVDDPTLLVLPCCDEMPDSTLRS